VAAAALVVPDPWAHLRAYTRARIALGRTGASLPTREVLDLAYAHARARDAVHALLDAPGLCRLLEADGFDTLEAHSAAADRAAYLLRPDLGRRLDPDSAASLRRAAGAGCDLLPVVGDGLSALAVERHAAPLLRALRALLPPGRHMGPVVVARQARVALGDPVGEILRARLVLMLIGERPGLSSPDSLGIYLTYGPRPGRLDAERNCISNVRPDGLAYEAAARRALWLTEEALRRGSSGVALKDESELAAIEVPRGLPDAPAGEVDARRPRGIQGE
jgi:ethanolamine ammonia-lyase small subunit